MDVATTSRPAAGKRRDLLRWLAWFTAANAACAGLICARYLWLYDWPDDAIGIGYALLAFVGQSALLALVWVLLPAATLAVTWPNRRAVVALAVSTGAALLTYLFVDANVFAQYRYHLDVLTAALFERLTWVAVGVQLLILLVFESLLARGLGRSSARRLVPVSVGRWLIAGLVACWLMAQGIHMWADAVGYVPVTQFTRYLPIYYPLQSKRRLVSLGLITPKLLAEQANVPSLDITRGALRYPLSPLSCRDDAAPLNLMVILIDALRPDAVHPELTPALVDLSRESLVFRNHWSGGNSSRMGIFSLAYGLPSTYWVAFDGEQRPPLLMDELRARHYAFVLASAPGFGSPAELERSVFASIPGLPSEREGNGIMRNAAVTGDWLDWLGHAERREPFFAFLYYDPPLQNMDGRGLEPLALDDRYPAAVARVWRQYRLAARFVDRQVAEVIESLHASGLWDRTVVVVTSDHGFEFDDSGLGYVGHATAFTPYQLRVPLIVHWPGKPPQEFTHRTSHHDLPPTLLDELFGCTTPPSEYSVGRNLFAEQDWPWLIAGSYAAYAIVTPDTTMVSQGGLAELRDSQYRMRGHLDAGVVRDALEAMRLFYR
jgi:membrane-anchored protein YejM (alkaline phosphatase superfamily)